MLIPFREALERLDYSVVTGAEYYHFARPVQLPDGQGRLKIDLLTGPPNPKIPAELIRIDERRVKPSARNSRLHGRLTKEAFSLEDHAVEVAIAGQRTTGELYGNTVFLPQPFHYLVMKLFAYRDAEELSNDLSQPDFKRVTGGRNALKHSSDLYTILSETDEQEWEEVRRLYGLYSGHPVVQEASGIVRSDFSERDATGLLRIRENHLSIAMEQFDLFRELLHEAFGLDQ